MSFRFRREVLRRLKARRSAEPAIPAPDELSAYVLSLMLSLGSLHFTSAFKGLPVTAALLWLGWVTLSICEEPQHRQRMRRLISVPNVSISAKIMTAQPEVDLFWTHVLFFDAENPNYISEQTRPACAIPQP
jgi:hypothetical protein